MRSINTVGGSFTARYENSRVHSLAGGSDVAVAERNGHVNYSEIISQSMAWISLAHFMICF